MEENLMTKADMARRWGVTRNVVHNWEKRHPDFPERAGMVNNYPVYKESDVERYEKLRIRTQLNKEG